MSTDGGCGEQKTNINWSLLLIGKQNRKPSLTGNGTREATCLYDLAEIVEIRSKDLLTQTFIIVRRQKLGKVSVLGAVRAVSFIAGLEQMRFGTKF